MTMITLGIFIKTSWFHRNQPNQPLKSLQNTVVYIYVALLPPESIYYISQEPYLAVECFMSIVHLPEEGYALPSWSQYFPYMSIQVGFSLYPLFQLCTPPLYLHLLYAYIASFSS